MTGELWHNILTYDHEIRKDTARKMQKGTPMPQALRGAWTNSEVKMKFFTDNFSVKRGHDGGGAAQGGAGQDAGGSEGGSKRARKKEARTKWLSQEVALASSRKGGKGKPKGGGKDKGGKHKGKGLGQGCASHTPDGQRICYGFNNSAERCAKTSCIFAHVCGKCFAKDVPMYSCSHPAR